MQDTSALRSRYWPTWVKISRSSLGGGLWIDEGRLGLAIVKTKNSVSTRNEMSDEDSVELRRNAWANFSPMTSCLC